MITIRYCAGTWVLSWPNGEWLGAFSSCQTAMDCACAWIAQQGRPVRVEVDAADLPKEAK